MPQGHDSNRLSWGDALFLYLEREGMPLNIASVSVFEGAISLRACRRFIQSKLPLIPRYLQRVVAPPFNLGLPAWEPDPYFDVRYHVKEVALKRGTEAEFKAACGNILSDTLDRQRPLWDLTLIRGLQGNRTGILTRAHHCLADGVAGVGLMNVIMDQSPEAPVLPRKPQRPSPSHRHDGWTSLVDLWVGSCSNIVEAVLSGQSAVLNIAERVLADSDSLSSNQFVRYLPELASPTERLFFNVTYRGPQKFAWAQIPTADIKAIRAASGATHNDVVLALITATIQRYAELHGDTIKGRLLRIMVPVNLRGGDGTGDLGNRISLLPVTIPLGIRNPRKLLTAARERMEFLKRAHVAELVSLAGGLLVAAPPALQALAGPVASRLPLTPFNLVCTNVRGPQDPLYLLGHKMLEWYPYVPVGGDMSLNCAILSYNGVSYFGFSGDVHAAPDLGKLETLLKLSFQELQKAAGISSPRKQSVRRKPRMKSTTATPIPKPVASVRTRPPRMQMGPSQAPAAEAHTVPAGIAAD